MLFGVPLAVSVLLALISWYGCEMWFLRLKTRLAL
jgi:peptidoglycan/LPS O-acetylase OafA/YrhL